MTDRRSGSTHGRHPAALALVLLLLLATATFAWAHGALRRSTPGAGARVAPPGELRLEFTEVAELATTSVTLLDAAGRTVPLAPLVHGGDSGKVVVARVPRVLAPGRYTVAWQLTGRDGHPVRGRFAFEVVASARTGGSDSAGAGTGATAGATAGAGGPPQRQYPADSLATRHPDSAGAIASAPPTADAPAAVPPAPAAFDAESPAYVALRWLSYVALVAGIGSVVLARITRRTATVGARHAVQTRLAGIGLAAAWLGIGLALGRLLAQSWAVHGADRAMSPMLLGPLVGSSTWGHAWILQLAAAMLAATGFTLALHDARGRVGWAVAELAALAAAAGTAMGGHAAAAVGWRMPLLLATDALHVLGAGAWIGGAMMLAFAVLPRADAPAAANVVRAFSPWGLGGAALLAVTGLAAAWVHLETPWAPWTSRYGRVLLVKLALVGIVVALGALNWRRLGPTAGTASGKASLRRSLWVEVLVATLVLGVTAVLVAVSPNE